MTTAKPTYIHLLPRVVEVGSLHLKLVRARCVLAGLWFRAMQHHAWQPHDVSDSVASSLSTSTTRNRDCLTAFDVSQGRFPKWFRWADGVADFLSCSSVLVNHFGLGSERGQLCVSRQWVRFLFVLSSASLLRHHAVSFTAATNRVGHSVAATMLWPMSTDMCGARSPHEYRIRVAYSAVAIWKEAPGRRGQAFLHWPRGSRPGDQLPGSKYAREAPTLAGRHRVSLSGWVSASSR